MHSAGHRRAARTRRNVIAGLALVLFSLLVVGVSRNRGVVVNGSGQTVRSLTVKVCGKTIRLGDIPPGGTASASFGAPEHESSFEVRGQLEDGKIIHEQCGYVVWEDFGSRFCIVIRSADQVEC